MGRSRDAKKRYRDSEVAVIAHEIGRVPGFPVEIDIHARRMCAYICAHKRVHV